LAGSSRRAWCGARSCIYDEGFIEADAANYRQLALNVATGWDRIALNPLRPSAK
jgi:hypothetical protein